MKSLMLSIFILLCIGLNAQDVKFPVNKTGEIEFMEVVQSKYMKSDLFSNAKEWIAKTFKDYKNVIQFDDQTNGKIIIKGKTPVNFLGGQKNIIAKTTEVLEYTITIECKDKKYRYLIDNVSVEETRICITGRKSTYNFTPLEHLKSIKSQTLVLENWEKKSKDLTLPTEERTKASEAVITNNNFIQDYITFYTLEYAAIDNLIKSLKKSMNKSNSF